MPLKPSGQTPTSSPAAQQPLGVRVAGQRLPGLAGQRAEPGRAEDQVGAEHPQVPVRRVVVEQRQRGHHRVERRSCRSGWPTTSAPPVDGHVLQAGRLDPEPLLVQRAERRGQHVLGEVAVEAEVVDLVVAGDPAAQERQAAGDPALPRPDGPAGRRRRPLPRAVATRRRRLPPLGRPVSTPAVRGSGPRRGASARSSPSPCSGITRASPTARLPAAPSRPPAAPRRAGRAPPAAPPAGWTSIAPTAARGRSRRTPPPWRTRGT